MKSPAPCLVLCALLGAVMGCARDANGMVITHDGRMVSETPDVARDELAWRLGQRAADAAGTGWHAVVTIDEAPTLHAVKADEFGWKTMTVHVTLVPPVGGVVTDAIQAKAESAVRDGVNPRIRSLSALELTLTALKAGTPAPGSQSYTTVAGDTWVGISIAFYGSAQHWRLIADANPGIDGAHMMAGTTLIIPPKP
jgi:hypothetical protein